MWVVRKNELYVLKTKFGVKTYEYKPLVGKKF